MAMYVWKVNLEVEWKYTVKSGKTSKTFTDNEEFTVASPTGVKAIEIAKKVALDKGREYAEWEESEDDWSDEDEVTTAIPSKVLDVVGLELKDELDG